MNYTNCPLYQQCKDNKKDILTYCETACSSELKESREMSYTKGEWKFNRRDRNYSTIDSINGSLICLLEEPHYMPDCGDKTWYNGQVEVMKANAHLIATAPEMYEALRALLKLADLPDSGHLTKTLGEIHSGRFEEARRVIAKVEGG